MRNNLSIYISLNAFKKFRIFCMTFWTSEAAGIQQICQFNVLMAWVTKSMLYMIYSWQILTCEVTCGSYLTKITLNKINPEIKIISWCVFLKIFPQVWKDPYHNPLHPSHRHTGQCCHTPTDCGYSDRWHTGTHLDDRICRNSSGSYQSDAKLFWVI